MSVYYKPRFVGRHLESESRYEHFLNYMSNYELNADAASIYRHNFEAQIKSYLKQASAVSDNLLLLEHKISSLKKKENLSVTGLVAQQDAAEYTMDALIYSREAILERLDMDGEK